MTEPRTPTELQGPPKGLSPTVRALGVVSLLTDVSSEMVYPVNPIFLTQVLGAAPAAVGIIEGVAESTASLLKLVSGWLSDRAGRRKPLTMAGYGLGAISKPLIAVSGAWWHVLAARFLDRTGKGLRSAPRDALIAESCRPEERGRAFGFHRGMDTAGAVGGPLLGYAFLLLNPGRLRWLYLLAFVPGVLSVAVLSRWVRERATPLDHQAAPPPVALPSWRSLSPTYRRYLAVLAIFSIGNSSDAFLLLRAEDMGVATLHLLLLYALFNVVEASLSYPVGVLSDRIGRKPLLVAGFGVFAAVYLGFALASATWTVWLLFPLYGLYYTLTGGVQRALAADLSHPERRATEIGAYHMLIGLAALPASILAGWLYGIARPLPFIVGAGAAALAVAALLATCGSFRVDAKPA
ncbi:MAG: MFS transporter [Chthonomonadales bacterium]|nr:MFS transporter [Chthonomonadales bacterium]